MKLKIDMNYYRVQVGRFILEFPFLLRRHVQHVPGTTGKGLDNGFPSLS